MVLKIGLDIDGVVANSFPVFKRELNRYYGKNIMEINQYDMAKLYDVTWDDLQIFFDEHMPSLFSMAEPMAGAVETIHHWLKEGHEIVFVTARKCGEEERVTLKWFEDHCIPKDKVIFVGGASKTFAIREFELDIFVEDFMGNALEIASIGVPVLLFNAPYNEGKLPKGVTRCYDWDGIKQCIAKLVTARKALG